MRQWRSNVVISQWGVDFQRFKNKRSDSSVVDLLAELDTRITQMFSFLKIRNLLCVKPFAFLRMNHVMIWLVFRPTRCRFEPTLTLLCITDWRVSMIDHALWLLMYRCSSVSWLQLFHNAFRQTDSIDTEWENSQARLNDQHLAVH